MYFCLLISREELISQLQDQIQLLDEDGAQLREQVKCIEDINKPILSSLFY